MMETNLEKYLPTGCNNFADIIDSKMIYVDKTDLVADLAQLRGSFFLSRPRRFGKSLLLTTFKELFEHGTQRFKSLKLGKGGHWTDTGDYKVVLVSFASCAEIKKGQNFDQKFGNELKKHFLKAGLTWSDEPDWADSFDAALDKAEERSIVLLIDEYDAPMTHVLTDPDEYENRRKILYSFFTTLKDFANKFRFTLITGVTRITNIGVFSGPNNVSDISFDLKFGAIAGFTQEELEHYFKLYIANAAQVLNEEEPQEQWDEQKVLDEIKANYDGYSFERRMKRRVYNPWSVINFFVKPEEGFEHYWLDSSNSTLVNDFLERLTAGEKGIFETLDLLSDKTFDCIKKDLSPVISHLGQENFPLKAVLYQAGYLTIKSSKGRVFCIGIPNQEVKTAFADVILDKLTEQEIKSADKFKEEYLKRVHDAFATKNLPAMKEVMNTIINHFSYECVKGFNERTFAEVLGILIFVLTLFRFKCVCEIQSAKGRADLRIRGGKYHYIIEIKVAYDRKDAPAAFEKGKEQFMDRKYANLIEPLIIVPCVMVIVNEPKKKEKSEKEEGSASMLREIAYFEELSLTDEQMTALKGAGLQSPD